MFTLQIISKSIQVVEFDLFESSQTDQIIYQHSAF